MWREVFGVPADEDGATTVEYAFVLMLIAIVCIAVAGAVGANTRNLFGGDGGMFPAIR